MNNIFFYILFLYIYYNNLINCSIVLPLYSNFSKIEENNISLEKLKENNLEKIFKIGIYSNISIGHPEQIIPTLISLKNSNLNFYILNKSLNGTYIKENSQTFKFFENPPKEVNWYDENYFSTILSEENFKFKDLKLNKINYNLSFNLVINSKKKELDYKSYIGLAPYEKEENINKISFLTQLKNKGYIFSNIFTLNFDKLNNKGEIIIGNYPHEYEPKKYKIDNLKVIGKEFFNEWIINFNYIAFKNNFHNISKDLLFEIDKKFNFKINLEINYIFLPKELSKEIDKIIILIYQNNCKKYDLEYSKYTYICDGNIDIKKFPTLILSLKIQKIFFELDYSDLFYKKNDTYFLLLKLNYGDLRYGEIGLPFLSKYQLVFHEVDLFVGYYLENLHKEYSIIIITLGISIFNNILFIIFYLRRYYKKKFTKTIDYSSNNDTYIEKLI